MNDERRSHHASTLRTFFNEQLDHLHSLVSSMNRHVDGDKESQTEEEKQILDSFVDAANIKMRAVHGFAEKLRGHVCELYSHVLDVAEKIPAPVDLSQDAFRRDPLVNALFVNTNDIDRLFKTNPEVCSYLHNHDAYQMPVIYALLTASKCEKSMLGVGILGDMLVRDVPHQVVNFSSHKIHIPCSSPEALDTALRKYLFDRIVALIKQEMNSRMAREACEQMDKSYESRLNSLANPHIYLNTLIEYLQSPVNLLSIDKNHYKLSKLGIKLDANDLQLANEFDVHELSWSDCTRELVLQISYSFLPTA